MNTGDYEESTSFDNNGIEAGSDELLADDNLRLPESAHTLVRVHAVEAWLQRRIQETKLELGEAALALQQAMMQESAATMTRLRRREQQNQAAQRLHAQQAMTEAQERLNAYEEAQSLLEECITHASGERVLVEFYLLLEDLVLQATTPAGAGSPTQPPASPRLSTFIDVLHRVERVGAPHEEE